MQMKDILKNYIASIPTDEYALFLSGGMDSILILMLLIELKKKVHAYTFFRLDSGHNVISSDFRKASHIAAEFNIPHSSVQLKMDNRDALIADLIELKKFGCKKKTDFECSYPFYKSAQKIQEQYIISGHAAEGNFCISKKGLIHYRNTQEKLEQFRDMYYAKPTQYHILKPLFDSFNKILPPYPFAQPALREWFRGKSWDECNKPKQKQPILDCLSEYKLPFPMDKHANLQLGDSGIAEGFEILLEGTRYKSPIAIYNRL